MNYPTENEVKKLGFVSRALAAFIFLCGLIAAAGVVYAVITEPLHPAIFFGALVIGALLHVSGCIVLKGYAPKYLLFAHGQK